MARIWFNDNENKWEKLSDVSPNAILDEHPSGEYVAMQALPITETTERAAIWNTKTGSIHWNPGNANALCWIEHGREMLVLTESVRSLDNKSTLYVTPIQSEIQHFIQRLSWPGLETIECVELQYPHGWLVDIVVSPTNALACFVWLDQCESGIEFIACKDNYLQQLPNLGYYSHTSNRIQGPVFSSNGVVLAMTFGISYWWGVNDATESSYLSDKRNVGRLVWSEVGSGEYKKIDIDISISEGWEPDEPDDILNNEFISKPEFLSPHEIKIVLPTGEERLLFLE